LCFINYSKTFDCVDHVMLCRTLHAVGFPKHIIIVLMKNLYDKQEATIRTKYRVTEGFPIGKGVRQGCILLPVHFNIYAEEGMRRAGIDE